MTTSGPTRGALAGSLLINDVAGCAFPPLFRSSRDKEVMLDLHSKDISEFRKLSEEERR